MEFSRLVLLGTLALAPGTFAWWTSRRLIALVDDPALGERLIGHRTRAGFATGLCASLLVALGPKQAIWTLPLLTLARSAASFHLHRSLYRATWTFLTYLTFYARLCVAVFGFWILLGATPWITSLGGTRDWMLALVLAVLLAIAGTPSHESRARPGMEIRPGCFPSTWPTGTSRRSWRFRDGFTWGVNQAAAGSPLGGGRDAS